MSFEEFRERIDRVDWSSLHGAYGPSDGSARRRGTTSDGEVVEVVLGDLPHAFAVLASQDDPASDAWANAMDELYSHAWHQGDLYEVTPHVVPVVCELSSSSTIPAEGRKQLAGYLVALAESAGRNQKSEDPAERDLAQQLDAALEAHADAIMRWLDTGLEQEAAFLSVHCVPLRQRILEALRARPGWDFGVFVALTLFDDPAEWVLERALERLDSTDHLEQLAAAAFVARSGRAPAGVMSRLEAILVPSAATELIAAVDLPIELEIPPIEAPFQGTLVEATIVFTGPKITLARATDGKDVTLPWPDAEVSKGHTVRVGLSPHGKARIVQWTDAEGQTKQVELSKSTDSP